MKFCDEDLADFLAHLDAADVDLGDFEADFVGSNLNRSEFSDKQRAVIHDLIEKYRDEIEW